MKRAIFILGSFVLSTAAMAQKSFSLKEAIAYSLQNHGSTRIQDNQLEISRQQSKEALSAYLPQVTASLGFDDNLKRQTTVIPGGAFGSNGDLKVQFGNKYNSNAVIQLDQTIYDQALLYGIKAGVPSQKIAELNILKNEEDLIYTTASAYSQILILKEQQKLLEANKKQYQQLYDVTKFRFDKGVAKKVDIDKVQVQFNNILAQQKQLQTNIDVACNALKNAMGMPLDSELKLEDSLNFSSYRNLPSEPVNVQNRIDYQLQLQSISLREIDVKRKQAAFLPTVSAYARYGGQAFGNDMGAAVGNWGNYSAIGLKVNIPIFSGRRREAQLEESKLELDNAKQNLDLSAGQLQLQFENAARQLQENITTLTTNKNNMDLAKSVYETSQFEYSKGVSSMSDLLNADFSYKQAQTNYMTSLLNLVSNRLEYERAKGTLKDFINKI
jgi:outer membrane protein TolC